MKIVITGPTGFVGSEVLAQALSHPDVTHIVLLARHPPSPLPQSPDKTIEAISQHDFSTYPSSLAPKLSGSESILWCLGGKHNNFPDLETAKRVNVEFIAAFADFIKQHKAEIFPEGKKLRVVLCSGGMAEWDQGKDLWFLAETRKMKGAAEKLIFEMVGDVNGEQKGMKAEAFTVRPAVILPIKPTWGEYFHGRIAPSVTVRELAAVMVELGVNGSIEHFWESKEIGRLGNQVLKRK